MTPEEKQAIIQLMGETYGQMHKQDQMLVSQSQHLKPGSPTIKQRMEEILRQPVTSQQPVAQQAPVSAPPPAITPEQAAAELQNIQATSPVQQPITEQSNQMEFDLSEPDKVDKIIELLEKQNLILYDIRSLLDNEPNTKNKKSR